MENKLIKLQEKKPLKRKSFDKIGNKLEKVRKPIITIVTPCTLNSSLSLSSASEEIPMAKMLLANNERLLFSLVGLLDDGSFVKFLMKIKIMAEDRLPMTLEAARELASLDQINSLLRYGRQELSCH